MRDPAQVIKDKLVAAGIGTFNATTGWNIGVGDPSEVPDTLILINQTGGQNPYPHLLYNEPSLQILVRGKKSGYVEARAKANSIVNVLLGMLSMTDTASGDVYRSCNQIGDIAYMGQDDNTRPMFVMNFWFIVLPATEAGTNRVAIE